MLCFPQQVPPWVTIDAVIRMWPLNPNWLDCKDCNREWVHKLQPFFEYIWKEGSVVTTNIPPCSGGGDTIRRRSTKRGQLEKNISKTKIKKGEWEVSPCTLWQYLWTCSDGICGDICELVLGVGYTRWNSINRSGYAGAIFLGPKSWNLTENIFFWVNEKFQGLQARYDEWVRFAQKSQFSS